MMTTTYDTSLSLGQLHILEMLNRCCTEESLTKLEKLLFDYYAQAAEEEPVCL